MTRVIVINYQRHLFCFTKEKPSAPEKQFVKALDITSKQPSKEDEQAPILHLSAKNEIERLLSGASKPPEKVKIKKVKVVTPRQEAIMTKTQEEEDLDKFEKESKCSTRIFVILSHKPHYLAGHLRTIVTFVPHINA